MVKMLKKTLENVLEPNELKYLFSSFDIIGDIVIIKIPDHLVTKKQIIARTILSKIKNVKSVFCQSSAIRGEYRIRDLEFLSGEDETVTFYREHGCIFKVDVAKTYFSPRLSSERLRIANMIKPNEVVVNMFAGVGTFSIIIAKKNKSSKVFSIDSNIYAHELCLTNVKLNKVGERVFPIHDDARSIVLDELRGVATRVLMPLPEKAKEFIESAVLSLKGCTGIIHFYSHVSADNKKIAVKIGNEEASNTFKGFDFTIENVHVIREVGPRVYQIESDVFIK